MTEDIKVSDETQVETKPKRRQNTEATETIASTKIKLGVYKLSDSVEVIPSFATDGSACFDLIANVNVGDMVNCKTVSQQGQRKVTDKGIAIHPQDRMLIPTGLIFDIPEGYCLKVYTRSGISFKEGITLTNCTGVIDSDYINELFVSVINVGTESKYIQKGDRIAQAKLEKLVDTEIVEIKSAPKQKTSRSGGFGSTGKS